MKEDFLDSMCNSSVTTEIQNFTEEKCLNELEGHNESFIAPAHSIGAALGALFSGLVLTLGPLNIILPLFSELSSTESLTLSSHES